MKVLHFETAVMVLLADQTVTVFPDGVVNVMPLDLPSHREHAGPAGYGDDGWRYIVEHDAIHHMLAGWQDRLWSEAVHDNRPEPLDQAPESVRREEHLVQRTQRLLMLNEPDPHGQLQAEFGDHLPGWMISVRDRLDRELGPIRRRHFP